MSTQYAPARFSVTQDGIEMPVSDLTTYQAEQHICRLLTLIREIQCAQLAAADSINRKLQKAGIELIK